MHLPRWLVVAGSVPFYRVGLHHRVPPRWGRRIMEASGRTMRIPAGTRVEQVTIGARPAERVTVGATERPRAVLYLHGGGYTLGSPRLYRATAAHLSRASGSVVFNLDYRLAPEHVFPAALDDAVAAFRDLVSEHGFTPSQIAIAGDSAGGGLAVAAARVLTDQGMRPGALGLLSPWTDPSDETFSRQRDFVTNVRWGRKSAAHYRGTADHLDSGYAPMHGRLDGLPPMLIHCSPVEVLHAQIHRFAERASSEQVEVRLVAHDRWWHSIHVLAGTLREATDAVHDVGVFLRTHLDAAAQPATAR
jgi:monoterpene epsilon-lactone hydrolase